MTKAGTLALLSTSAILLLMPGVALAQQGDVNSANTDIIVTAQKRSERLSDVPLSITAASAQELSSRGISSPEQLEKIVPGFTYQQSQLGVPVFAIRGIGFFEATIGAAPTVTVYTDQMPLPFLVMARGATMDLERVEVLKGPQGTLFGQNSTGGAINYITAKPTSNLDAGFRLEGARFDTVNAEAFVSGPIGEGLTARIAGRYEYSDGWQISQTRPNADYAGRRFYNGRFLLDWKPSDAISFELNATGWKDRSQIPAPQFVGFAPQAPLNPFNAGVYAALSAVQPAPNKARVADFDANRTAPSNVSMHQFSLRGDMELADNVTLSSLTSYAKLTSLMLTDLDGTAFNDLYSQVDGRIKTFSQELRLAGTAGAVRWMVGGNYQHDQVNENRTNFLNSTNNGVGPSRYDSVGNISRQKVRTLSGFGSIDVEVANGLTLQGSGRYTDQRRDFAGCLNDPGNGQLATTFSGLSTQLSGSPTVIARGACVTLNNDPSNTTTGLNKPLPIVNDRLNENNFSYRAGVNWKPNAATLVYGNITKGYKSGNYSILPAVFASQLAPVTQESVVAYEVGYKGSFAQRAIQITAAGFYYDYKDKQLLGAVLVPIFGNLPQLVNIPKSRVYGGEIELVARPVDGLRLTGGVTYVNSRVQRDPLNPRDPLGNLVSFVGSQFPNTPKWQGVADAEYQFPVSNSLNMMVGAGGNFRSSSYAQFGEIAQIKIPAYALLDLRTGIMAADGRWGFQIWGRNVTNKFYLTGASRNIDTFIRFTGQPATYGATLSFRY